MKIFLLYIFFIQFIFISENAFSQNVTINVATQNAGIVKKGETVFFEIAIYNSSTTKVVPAYKLRPQISFPTTLVSVENEGHILPKGWAILLNKNGVVTLSNGKDSITQSDNRRILIAIKGIAIGGPTTISGNLLFANGIAPGLIAGPSTIGDNLADNISTSTIMVID